MSPNAVVVDAKTRLHVTYSFHPAAEAVSDSIVVLHHGICHTREQFVPLVDELNQQGIHAAIIDQQSEGAGFFRNCIGVKQYREGMAAAVRAIQKHTDLPIGSYALHSMGALIGEEMQQKHTGLQRPTVLMAPVPLHGALPITLRILQRHPLSYLKAVLTLDIHSLAKTPEQVRELFFNHDTPNTIVEETTAQLKHAPFWIYCQLVLRPIVRPRIRKNEMAKILLFSDTDEIFHPREYSKTRKRYRLLAEYQIKGGHDFFIEHAAAAAKRIADFHKQHGFQPTSVGEHIPEPHMLQRPGGTVSAEGKNLETQED